MPRTLSSLRSVGCPIYAFMEEEHVHRKMSLLWGVESFQMKFEPKAEDNITLALIRLRDEGHFDPAPIRRIWKAFLDGERKWHTHLWGVLMFQAWREGLD